MHHLQTGSERLSSALSPSTCTSILLPGMYRLPFDLQHMISAWFMCRRITNRESAKYMREMRLQDMDAVRKEVMALLNRTAELQDLLLKAHELQAELQQHSSSWQQLWSAAAASNIKLSGRLAAHERMASAASLAAEALLC